MATKIYFSHLAPSGPAIAGVDLRRVYVCDTLGELNAISTASVSESGVVGNDTYRWTGAAWEQTGTGGSSYTDEMAQDAIAAIFGDSAQIDITYVDGAPSLAATIIANSITAVEIAANAVGSSELADDAVDAAAIQTGAVGTSEIADGVIVAADLATNTLTANEIAANAIGSSELADDAVDAGAVAAGAVGTSEIADGAVAAADVASGLLPQVGSATIDFGAFPGSWDTSLAITGQAGILAGSVVTAWLMPTATADHSVDEHWSETIIVVAGNIVPGVGFTIYARQASERIAPQIPIAPPGTIQQAGATAVTFKASAPGRPQEDIAPRIYGTWKVGWMWV